MASLANDQDRATDHMGHAVRATPEQMFPKISMFGRADHQQIGVSFDGELDNMLHRITDENMGADDDALLFTGLLDKRLAPGKQAVLRCVAFGDLPDRAGARRDFLDKEDVQPGLGKARQIDGGVQGAHCVCRAIIGMNDAVEHGASSFLRDGAAGDADQNAGRCGSPR
ncbi:MAG TPA: hypothetical protein VNS79_11220 [Sphingobium sp.]|nr:hypothetical protein [Sphingobium sp.]